MQLAWLWRWVSIRKSPRAACSQERGWGGVFAESDMDSLAELAKSNGVPLKVLSAGAGCQPLSLPITWWKKLRWP